ncbi:MAG TPA: TetR/AcrR family transcriptional regulator [Anaerolineae bacterium]|nr:TetR/AcrR family transcriptional regulator [Anaerolineae bacterium]
MTHRRDRMRAATLAEIKQLARKQMAEQGMAALSFSAIAEQMGFTSQALYRYVPSRDALITSLVVDACTDLAAAMEAARDAIDPEHDADRLLAVMLAYREWAVGHPIDYALIYGKPIPDYRAPETVIGPAIQRIPMVVLGLLRTAWLRGRVTALPEYGPLPAELETQLAALRHADVSDLPLDLLHTVLVVWSQLHGLITLEIFEHLHPALGDFGALYRFEARTLLKRVGLHPKA